MNQKESEEKKSDKKEFLKELEKAKILLLISKEDLESSEILFKSKKYPNSIWCLHQSIEKSTKSLALINGSIKFKELKEKIGHNPFKMYESNISDSLMKIKNLEKSFQKLPSLEKIPMMQELKLEEFKEKNKYAKKIISLVAKNKKIFSDDIKELDGAIGEMNSILKEIKDWRVKKFGKSHYKQFREAWVENIKAFVKLCKEQGNPIDETEEKQALSISDEDIKIIVERVSKTLVLGSMTHTFNVMLNILINPHFEFLRYPDLKNPLEYYTEENPLIKRLDKLFDIQKNNILLHEEYLEFIEELTKEVKIN